MEAECALDGRLAAAVASVAGAVSTQLRHSQRPRHPSRQYTAAPEFVGAPSPLSFPHRARVSERTIQVSAPRGTRRPLAAGGRRAQLVPQLEHPACRVTYGTIARTNRLGQRDSSAQTSRPRERARGPPARVSQY